MGLKKASPGLTRLRAILRRKMGADGSRKNAAEEGKPRRVCSKRGSWSSLPVFSRVFLRRTMNNGREQWAAGGTSEKRKSTCRGGLGKFEEALGPLAYVRFPAETWLGAGAKPGIMIGARTFVDRNE